MPLALQLSEPLSRLTAGVRVTFPLWTAALAGEEGVLGNARSLYLVRWWGAQVPLQAGTVHAWVDNLAALRARLALNRDESRTLLEPSLGLAGRFAGAAVSPIGALVVALPKLRENLLDGIAAIVTALVWGAIAGGLLPVAGPIAMVFKGLPAQADTFDALGRLADALGTFWTLLEGPREAIANPVVKEALTVTDQLAGLTALLAGALAFFIVRIGPEIGRLATQLEHVAPLGLALGRMLVTIYEHTVPPLKASLVGETAIWKPLETAFDGLGGAFKRLGPQFAALWHKLVDDWLLAEAKVAKWDIEDWWKGVERWLDDAPFIVSLAGIDDRLELVTWAWKSAVDVSVKHEKPTYGDKFAELLETAAKPITDLQPPGQTTWPARPVRPAFEPLPKLKDPPWLSLGIDKLAAPAHFAAGGVLAGRLGALRAAAPATEGVGHAELDAFRALAERIVGPGALEYVRKLESVLEWLHVRRAEKPKLPVKSLAEPSALRPRVGVLRVRVAGSDRTSAEAWTAGLRQTLERQTYAAAGA